VTFYPRGPLVFILFAATLSLALIPRWGTIAAGVCIVVELFLLFGVAGFGRGSRAK
jgi:hypothetical protein